MGRPPCTADALFLVHQDLAVLGLVGRARRADLHARGVLAALADGGEKVLLDLRELSHRTDREHLVVVHAEGHVVFLLAGDFARKASDAAVEVDNHCLLGHDGLR